MKNKLVKKVALTISMSLILTSPLTLPITYSYFSKNMNNIIQVKASEEILKYMNYYIVEEECSTYMYLELCLGSDIMVGDHIYFQVDSKKNGNKIEKFVLNIDPVAYEIPNKEQKGYKINGKTIYPSSTSNYYFDDNDNMIIPVKVNGMPNIFKKYSGKIKAYTLNGYDSVETSIKNVTGYQIWRIYKSGTWNAWSLLDTPVTTNNNLLTKNFSEPMNNVTIDTNIDENQMFYMNELIPGYVDYVNSLEEQNNSNNIENQQLQEQLQVSLRENDELKLKINELTEQIKEIEKPNHTSSSVIEFSEEGGN